MQPHRDEIYSIAIIGHCSTQQLQYMNIMLRMILDYFKNNAVITTQYITQYLRSGIQTVSLLCVLSVHRSTLFENRRISIISQIYPIQMRCHCDIFELKINRTDTTGVADTVATERNVTFPTGRVVLLKR